MAVDRDSRTFWKLFLDFPIENSWLKQLLKLQLQMLQLLSLLLVSVKLQLTPGKRWSGVSCWCCVENFFSVWPGDRCLIWTSCCSFCQNCSGRGQTHFRFVACRRMMPTIFVDSGWSCSAPAGMRPEGFPGFGGLCRAAIGWPGPREGWQSSIRGSDSSGSREVENTEKQLYFILRKLSLKTL